MNTWIVLTLYLFSHQALGFSKAHLEKIKNKKDITYADLAHENLGCPENSECSKANGKKLLKWSSIIKKYADKPRLLSKKLEKFRKQNGIPVEFLLHDNLNTKQTLDPIVWDSRCRHHNPKEGTKIVKGMKFFRNNPKTDKLKFIQVKTPDSVYEIPYGDQPLFIRNKELIIVKEYEEAFYHMSISPKGKWKILNVRSSQTAKGRINRENADCKTKTKGNEYFLGSYCAKIWDEDKKDSVLIEQDWTCP